MLILIVYYCNNTIIYNYMVKIYIIQLWLYGHAHGTYTLIKGHLCITCVQLQVYIYILQFVTVCVLHYNIHIFICTYICTHVQQFRSCCCVHAPTEKYVHYMYNYIHSVLRAHVCMIAVNYLHYSTVNCIHCTV